MLASNIFTDKTTRDPYGSPLLILTTFGFLLYVNTFGNYWSYDDYFVVLGNADVKSLENFIENNYPGRPLRELSFMLDYHLFGFAPAGWHFQNILWHSLNAWLIYVLSLLLSDNKQVAWIASILFLAHPLQVEVVAQVSHRKDSLALLFMLASFVFYLSFKKKDRKHFLVLAAASMALAVLSKENAIILPILVMAYEYFPDNRTPKERLYGKGIVLAMLVFIAIASIHILGSYNYLEKASALLVSNNYFNGIDFSTYLLAIINSWGHIFFKLLFPFNLSPNYILEVPSSFLDPKITITLLALSLYTTSLVFSFKRSRFLFLSLLWLGLLYLPTSNIIPINHLAADRYMYAPSVGFFMAVAFLLNKTCNPRLIPYFIITIVFGLSILTIHQNRVWQNNATLWTHSLKINPNSARALSNVGMLLYGDDVDSNLEMQLRANGINPYDPFVAYWIGSIYEEKGEVNIALNYYKKSHQLFIPSVHGMYKEILLNIEEKLSQNHSTHQ